MHKARRYWSLMLAVIMLLSLAVVAHAQESDAPNVTVDSQTVADNSVLVEEVVAAQDGWIVIHAQADGAPGPVVGHAPVSQGVNQDVSVEVDLSDYDGIYLYAMLHVDEGEAGTYEFPGADGPVTVDGEVVSPLFTIVRPSQPADDEDVAEEEEEAAAEEEQEEEEAAAEEMAEETPGTVIDVAMDDDRLETLVAAIQAAGLSDVLSGEGPYTVLAPTDNAFAELPEGTLAGLLEDPAGALTELLNYHVVSGSLSSADLSDGMEVETLQGASLTVGVSDDGVTVNGANVLAADVEAGNGVIHIVDSVLMPADTEVIEEETAEDDMAEDDEAEDDEAEEQPVPADFTPSVTARDQVLSLVDGPSVGVAEVFATEDGWMVIHQDDDGAPGPVLGYAPVTAGENYEVGVPLDEPVTENVRLWAMLHVDAGEEGTFEFPGPDSPATLDDEVVMAPFTALIPSVDVGTQEVEDGSVTIEAVTTAADSWLVVHRNTDDDTPGEVIGHAPAAPGVTPSVSVELEADVSEGDTLWAMLHYDLGTRGEYEFPGEDVPITLEGAPIMTSFTIGPAEAEAPEEEMADEEMAEDEMAEERAAEEPVEAEATAEPMAEEPMEEADAPEVLPVTGASLAEDGGSNSLPWTMAATVAALAGLAIAGTLWARRRLI